MPRDVPDIVPTVWLRSIYKRCCSVTPNPRTVWIAMGIRGRVACVRVGVRVREGRSENYLQEKYIPVAKAPHREGEIHTKTVKEKKPNLGIKMWGCGGKVMNI